AAEQAQHHDGEQHDRGGGNPGCEADASCVVRGESRRAYVWGLQGVSHSAPPCFHAHCLLFFAVTGITTLNIPCARLLRLCTCCFRIRPKEGQENCLPRAPSRPNVLRGRAHLPLTAPTAQARLRWRQIRVAYWPKTHPHPPPSPKGRGSHPSTASLS